MTYTSDRPFRVDGVRLDTLAWNIQKINRASAARRTGDVQVPGLDGVLASLNDDLEPITFGLEMFVRGTDVDGKPISGRTQRDVFRENLDGLVHLFGKRHELLHVEEQVGPGLWRQCRAKVVDSIVPEMVEHGGHGTFSVALTIPSGVWEDQVSQVWDSGPVTLNNPMEVTTLRGATERSNDAIILVKGPIHNPVVGDVNTGAWIALTGTIAAGSAWRVNVGTWSSRLGAGLVLESPDSAGTDVSATTRFGGTNNAASYLPLVPVRDPDVPPDVAPDEDGVPYYTSWVGGPGSNLALDTDGVPYILDPGEAPPANVSERRVRLSMGATGGVTSETRLQVLARRKYGI